MSLLLLDTTSSSSSVRSKKLVPSSSGKFGVAGDKKKLVAGLIRGLGARRVSSLGREGSTADAGTPLTSNKSFLDGFEGIRGSELKLAASLLTDSEEIVRLKGGGER